MPVALDRKYARYVNRRSGYLHIALLGAVAAVPFNVGTSPKALRAAFEAQFRRLLASTVDLGLATRH